VGDILEGKCNRSGWGVGGVGISMNCGSAASVEVTGAQREASRHRRTGSRASSLNYVPRSLCVWRFIM
jgi:hypothetical protein